MSITINNTFLTYDMAQLPPTQISTIHPIKWPKRNPTARVVRTAELHEDSRPTPKNSWLIPLPPDREPITDLTFLTSSLKVLWDTGSDYSAISSSTLYKIMPGWKKLVTHIDFNTLGPDNRPILCYGQIVIDFDIMGDLHTDKFLVIHSEFHNALIGYNFMKSQGITICAGKYLTNSNQQPSHLSRINNIATTINNVTTPATIPLIVAQPAEIFPNSKTELFFKIPDKFKEWVPTLRYTCAPIVAIGLCEYRDIPIDANGGLTISYTDTKTNFAYTIDEGAAHLAAIFYRKTSHINNLVTPHSMVSDVINSSEDQIEINSLEFSASGIHYPSVETTSQNIVLPTTEPITIRIEATTNSHPCNTCSNKSFTTCDTTDPKCILHINNVNTSHGRNCLLHLYQCTGYRNMIFTHCNDCYPLRKLLADYWNRTPITQSLFSYFLVNQSIVMFIEGSSLISEEKCDALAKKIQFLAKKYFIPEIYVTGHYKNLKDHLETQNVANITYVDTLTGTIPTTCALHPISSTQLRNIKALDRKELEASIYTRDPETLEQLATIIQERVKLFAVNTFDIGTWAKDGIPYLVHIRLLDDNPIVHKFRPIHHSKLRQATEIMKGLRDAGIISRRVTNWSSNAVWALKAIPMMTRQEAESLNIPYVPGTESRTAVRPLRLTIDLRELNTKVAAPACILPNVKSIFSEIRDSEMLTILDLVQAYFCLSYSEESARVTGFNCGIPDEQLHVFTRTVMGLRSSQAALTSALFHTIGPLRQFVFSYSDNLVIHSTKAQHTEIVNKVLGALLHAGFKLSLSKSIFAITGEVKIFGLVYNPTTKLIAPDQSKMKSLASLKPPTSFTQLKSFLGSVNFVVNHLEGIKDHMAVLFSLTRDNKEFQWSEEAQNSYDSIIAAIENHQKLYVLDYNNVAILSIDSSLTAAGGILAQIHPQTGKYMVNSYYQKLFSVQEGKLMNFEREALGLVSIYKMAANTVFGCSLCIVSDCRAVVSLKYLSNQSHKVSRWMSILEAHVPDIQFIHLKNTSDLVKISDYISRTPPLRAHEVALSSLKYTPAPQHLKDRRATLQDAEKVDMITKKLQKTTATIVDYDIALDYLLSITDRDLMSIDDDTVFCDSGFVIFRRSGNSPEKVEVRQRLKPYRPLEQISLCQIHDESMHNDNSFVITHPTDDDLPFNSIGHLNNVNIMTGGSLPPIADSPLRFLQYFTTKFPQMDIRKIIELQRQDPQCKTAYEKCKASDSLEWRKNDSHKFLIRQGVLLHMNSDQEDNHVQLYIPAHMVLDTLQSLHRTYSHPGANKLIKLFTANFYTPGITRHVNNLLSQCYFCAINKPAQQYKRPLFQHTIHKTLKGPGILFSTDVIKISNNAGTTNSLLTFTCCYSLYTIVYPIAQDLSSQGFIDILVNCFLPTVNFSPSYLLMDNASYYVSNMTRQALTQLNITQVTICPYSPSNNPSERLQKQLLSMIRIAIQEKSLPPHAWPKIVQFIVSLMNSTPFTNVIFPLSPADVFFGRKCHPSGLIPFLQFNDENAEATPLSEDIGKTRKLLHKFTAEIAKLRKQFYQKEHIKIRDNDRNEIIPGDLVAMIDVSQNLMGYNRKLRPRFKKLYWVVKTTSTAAFCRPTTKQKDSVENDDTDCLVKIEKRLLKKLKPTILFPLESKLFNSNFNHSLPEPLDFYYEETREDAENSYSLPDGIASEPEHDYTSITAINSLRTKSNGNMRRDKIVRFSDTVHFAAISNGDIIYTTHSLVDDKNTAYTESFFGIEEI